MKHSYNIITLMILFMASAASVLWAEDMPVPGFDRVAYDLSFNVADRTSEVDEWLKAARSGVAFSVARWEQTAVDLYADSEAFSLAKQGVETWTSENIAKRFAVWLRDRFFGREAAYLYGLVVAQTGESNKRYLYETNEAGSIVYDDVGNPVYREQSEEATIDDEQSSWHDFVGASVEQALTGFSLKLESLRPELLAYIPEEDKDLYNDLVMVAAQESIGRAGRELDGIARREEALFIARRTVDMWSLRKRSEKETASAIAEDLVLQTGIACDKALDALRVRIDLAAAGTGDLAIEGADWLEAFSEQFDRGLSAWQSAEERFIVKRLEWDRDASHSFDEGNKAWSEAFDRFETERIAWEAKASSLFRSGEEAFSRADETLARSILEARTEFERDATERTVASSERASAWVDVYLQAGSAAASAFEAAGYWLSLLEQETPEIDTPELRVWLDNEIARSSESPEDMETLLHLVGTIDMYQEYRIKSEEARLKLIDDFGLALGSKETCLHDVLQEGASSENFNLDEYQVELIHAAALEGYWKRRVEVAQAVFEYSDDLSSGRATESDSLQLLLKSKLEYDSALLEYETAQNTLQEKGLAIAEGRVALDAARAELAEIGEQLEMASSEYSILMSVLAVGDASFIKEEMIMRYRELLVQSGLSDIEGSPSEAELVTAYLARAMQLGYAEDLERSGFALKEAVEGREGEESLAGLSSAWKAILVPSFPDLAPLDASLYGIPENDTAYMALELVFKEMHLCLDTAASLSEEDTIRSEYRVLATRIAEGAKARAATMLGARLDGLALLGADSPASWYVSCTGTELPDGSVAAALQADLGARKRSLLADRAVQESAALDVVLGLVAIENVTQEAAYIARWWNGNSVSAASHRSALAALLDLITASSTADDASFARSLEVLASDHPSLAEFARGRGYFSAAGYDVVLSGLGTQTDAVNKARGRLDSWNRYGSLSLALESDRLEIARATVAKALRIIGVAVQPSDNLPELGAVGTALFADGIDTSASLASLCISIDDASENAPAWMKHELGEWKESLVAWVAARSLYLGAPPPASSLIHRSNLSEASDRTGLLARVLSGLSGDDAQVNRALSDALSAIEWNDSEHDLIANELARRISLSLKANSSALSMEPDWDALETSLASDAENTFGYVLNTILDDAIKMTLEDLQVEDAIAYQRNLDLLHGPALEARLEDIWFNMDWSEAMAVASTVTNPVSLVAWYMRTMIYGGLAEIPGGADRNDILALSLPGADGEASWLDEYYSSYGEDSATIMENLLGLLAGSAEDEWNFTDAQARVESYAAATLDGAVAYRDNLRLTMGSASLVGERLMAVTIAGLSGDAGFLSWVLGILGLEGSAGVDAFLSSGTDGCIQEAFLGLSPADAHADYAAESYLTMLALHGDRLSFDSAVEQASLDAQAPGRRYLHIIETVAQFAGEYSGDSFSWAARVSDGNIHDAINLVRYLETGTFENSEIGMGDPFNRWIIGAIAEKSLTESDAARMAMVLMEYSSAYESALAEAGNGLKHWRQMLPDPLVLVEEELAGPVSAGNPEGGQGATPRAAGSWAEGALADAFEEATRRSAIVNAAYETWADIINNRNADDEKYVYFTTIVKGFIDDPETEFDDELIHLTPSALASGYQEAYGEYSVMGSRRREASQMLGQLASAYAIASDTSAITARVSELEAIMETSRASHNEAMTHYRDAGNLFEILGHAYDQAYSELKSLYQAEESARFQFEKADAIRRWASTAYLDSQEKGDLQIASTEYMSPAAELSYSEDSLGRASAALAALANLYSADENERPYEDARYAAAYETYRENYSRMILLDNAHNILAGELRKEYLKNNNLFEDYQDSFQGMEAGISSDEYEAYLKIDEYGRIRFAYDAEFTFAGASTTTELDAFFNELSTDAPGGRHQMSAFQTNLADLASWMTDQTFSEAKTRQWGLARDYVIGRLSAGDAQFGESSGITGASVDDELLGGHRFLPLGKTLSVILDEYRSGELFTIQKTAYENLGAEERYWFETYLALELSGAIRVPTAGGSTGDGIYDAFSYWSKRMEYEQLEKEAAQSKQACITNQKISAAAYAGFLVSAALAGATLFLGFLVPWFMAAAGVAYTAMIGFALTVGDINTTQAQYSSEMNDLRTQTSANVSYMTAGMAENIHALSEYTASAERLDILEGKSSNGTACDVLLLRSSLSAAEGMTEDELDQILHYFELYQAETGSSHESASLALAAMSNWSANARLDSRNELEQIHADAEAAQANSQLAYVAMLESYIAGTAHDAELNEAAIAAFGPNVASDKRHLQNLAAIHEGIALKPGVQPGLSLNGDSAREYAQLAEKAYDARYSAELSVREYEWSISRKDLAEKRAAWLRAAGVILERGRADFEHGIETMRDRYATWTRQFYDEYERKTVAWNLAYASMNGDRSAWVADATEAALNASTGAILALVGSDALASARRIDTFSVTDMKINIDAINGYDKIASMAGISGMDSAMFSLARASETTAKAVRTGMGGVATWDSGRIAMAASAFAENTHRDIAGLESMMIAASTRDAAKMALSGLRDNVVEANIGFNKSMNSMFVNGGSWKRQGDNFVKDVVVHSTVGNPFITEHAELEAYAWYPYADITLQTDLSDATLERLDHLGIETLIKKAQDEVAKASDGIFGSVEDLGEEAVRARTRRIDVYRDEQVVIESKNITWIDENGVERSRTVDVYGTVEILDHTVEQTLGAGEFGRHIGYAPVSRIGANPDDAEGSLFESEGTGELGRLLAKYIYWSLKEGKGWSEANKALYEKDLWDDRGDWFKAPTIRGVADIGVTVAASLLSGGAALPAMLGAAAINLADDAVFGALDIAGGYKAWEEAGLDFGKKAATAAVNFFGGNLFSGAMAQAADMSGLDAIVGKAALGGIRTAATGFTSSAIQATTWNQEGIGWSSRSFAEGVTGTLAEVLAGGASGLSSGIMDLGLEGYTGSVYSNGTALSGFTGALAGQGTRYALTGTASFNVLDLDLLGLEDMNGNIVSSGLLMLDVGADGTSMALGTGGMDVGFNACSSAFKGLEAWSVNARIAFSGQEETTRYTSAMRTLYASGSDTGPERNLFENLLAGNVNILENATGEYSAETAKDSSGGTNTIRLGQGALLDTSRFGLNILLSHEAYRDGVDNGLQGQTSETRSAVLGHIMVASKLASTYGIRSMGASTLAELQSLEAAYSGDTSAFEAVASGYDSSSDYWKLTKNGSLAYDALATLRDENGNIIRSAESMGLKETQIEGSLVAILGYSALDKTDIEAVRQLMVSAGMQHSYSQDSSQWLWRGAESVMLSADGSFPGMGTIDLSTVNVGKIIDLEAISNLYAATSAVPSVVSGFIEGTYGSAIGMLEYAGQTFSSSADVLLSDVYSRSEVKMIYENQEWYRSATGDGVSIDSMISGGAKRTSGFGIDTGNLALATSSVAGASYFSEQHTGIDYGRGGESILTPGGYWQFVYQQEHKAYFQLFGGDLRMRFMHIDPSEIKKLEEDVILGGQGESKKLFDYPSTSFGSGTGAHVHIDFTRRLPYGGSYLRQFVNPETLQPGNQLEYAYSYKDSRLVPLEGYPLNFYRY